VDDFDRVTERLLRGFASRTSRRSMLSVIGAFLAGGSAFPLLPVARASEGSPPEIKDDPPQTTGNPQDPGDPSTCEYWRYCGMNGSLCTCYGGTTSTCPPGTEMSQVTWIGTCHNPADNRDYIISYNDCCGGVAGGRCQCERNEGDRGVVRPTKDNEIVWCFGTQSQSYTCTTAIILGTAAASKR
jgi:methylamine dehydrogenase light chain